MQIIRNRFSDKPRLKKHWGAWVAQSVKRLTLDFGSAHDLTDVRSSPTSGTALSWEPA